MTRPDIVWPTRTLGLRQVFLPAERAILSATYDALPAPAGNVLKRQIELMHRATRYLTWTEVLFYPATSDSDLPRWRDEDLFPNRHEDLKIARVVLKAEDQRHTAFVHIVVGHFFAITARPGLKVSRRANVEISSVSLLADPMDPSSTPARNLPRSYMSFVSREGAGRHHGWDVLRPDDVYEVALEDGTFLVLAVHAGDSFLLTRQGGGGLFLCEHDDKPRRVKTTFEATLANG